MRRRDLTLKAGGLRSENPSMRPLLEFLGLVEPDRSRREPVALPTWVIPTAIAILFGGGALVAIGLGLLFRALFIGG